MPEFLDTINSVKDFPIKPFVNELLRKFLAAVHYVNINLKVVTSIDEDALGEALEVIWEIESGAHVIQRAGLSVISGHDKSEMCPIAAIVDGILSDLALTAD